ncbi:MAG: AAA family ATPase [Aestuariivita sp.]|nr:AAA family ATPase [Aestuariivita sp.]MCY4202748.1 AAA family ATPase [Aestuariivita sp.]
MTRRTLPIGIQDFQTIRSEDFYYVDKTRLIRKLVDSGRFFFLSRPRRFGKSLLLNTLKALFEGQEKLFEGLDIHGHWDWSVTHPVVRLSFGKNYNRPEDIESNLKNQFNLIEHAAGLKFAGVVPNSAPERLQSLLYHLHDQTGQRVAVLVDEYDKPILDVLRNPEQAKANREYLRGFYGMIKDSAEHIRFVFVTGVSMFSKVSLFSGLNNLEDISLDPRFATLCGYTDIDLDTVFAPELEGLDRNMIRTWYNGYNWRGTQRLYNPFDVLLLFQKREFNAHWFETGSPGFLFETLTKDSVHPLELEGCVVDKSLVAKFDINDICAEALMFQTGYLTITKEMRRGHRTIFQLDYPNLEVKLSLNDEFLAYLSSANRALLGQVETLRDLLEVNDFEGFASKLTAYMASIPYQWKTTGNLAHYEAWYAGLLHMSFITIGADIRSEESTSRGRSDFVVLTGRQVFLFEFKMVGSVAETEATLEAALAQMRNQGYAEKYRDRKEPIHLIAVACGRAERNVLAVRAEPFVVS